MQVEKGRGGGVCNDVGAMGMLGIVCALSGCRCAWRTGVIIIRLHDADKESVVITDICRQYGFAVHTALLVQVGRWCTKQRIAGRVG